jgi:Na+/H+ antiporter NhaC
MISPGLIALIPAAVTILVALAWRRVWLALACGVVAGALAFGGFHPLPVLKALWLYLTAAFVDQERLKIILFILLVGGMLEILAASGAYEAFAHSLSKVIHTARRTRLAAWFLSFSLFFDDYANVLITGSSMRSVAERNQVRPAMMAYFVDTVAILASVMLVSTWAAFEGNEMADAAQTMGIQGSATALFLGSLPYHFYTYLAIFLSFLVALQGRWFGSRLDTRRFMSMQNSEVSGEGASLRHVLMPMATLVVGAFAGLFIVGAWKLWRAGEPLSFLGMLWAAPTVDVLLGATLLALGLAVILFKKDGVLGKRTMRPAFARGVRDMLEIGLIIVLATGLSKASTDLGAGPFLAQGFTRILRPEFIPVGVYTLAMLVTVSTGFSWGSMAIVMPVAFSLAATSGGAHLVPILSAAVITGAVSGEHLIPYSEKVVLSATACGIPPVYHFKTQFPQAFTAFLVAGFGFLSIGFGWPLWICYAIPTLALLTMHLLLAKPSKEG